MGSHRAKRARLEPEEVVLSAGRLARNIGSVALQKIGTVLPDNDSAIDGNDATEEEAQTVDTDIKQAPHTHLQPVLEYPPPRTSIRFTNDQFERTILLANKVPGPAHARVITLHNCLTWDSFQERVFGLLGLTSDVDQVDCIIIKFEGLERTFVISSLDFHHAMPVQINY